MRGEKRQFWIAAAFIGFGIAALWVALAVLNQSSSIVGYLASH